MLIILKRLKKPDELIFDNNSLIASEKAGLEPNRNQLFRFFEDENEDGFVLKWKEKDGNIKTVRRVSNLWSIGLVLDRDIIQKLNDLSTKNNQSVNAYVSDLLSKQEL